MAISNHTYPNNIIQQLSNSLPKTAVSIRDKIVNPTLETATTFVWSKATILTLFNLIGAQRVKKLADDNNMLGQLQQALTHIKTYVDDPLRQQMTKSLEQAKAQLSQFSPQEWDSLKAIIKDPAQIKTIEQAHNLADHSQKALDSLSQHDMTDLLTSLAKVKEHITEPTLAVWASLVMAGLITTGYVALGIKHNQFAHQL